MELAVLCMPESKKLRSIPERHKRSKKQRAHFRTKNLNIFTAHVSTLYLTVEIIDREILVPVINDTVPES